MHPLNIDLTNNHPTEDKNLWLNCNLANALNCKLGSYLDGTICSLCSKQNANWTSCILGTAKSCADGNFLNGIICNSCNTNNNGWKNCISSDSASTCV